MLETSRYGRAGWQIFGSSLGADRARGELHTAEKLSYAEVVAEKSNKLLLSGVLAPCVKAVAVAGLSDNLSAPQLLCGVQFSASSAYSRGQVGVPPAGSPVPVPAFRDRDGGQSLRQLLGRGRSVGGSLGQAVQDRLIELGRDGELASL